MSDAPPSVREIAELIIGNLDPDGFLVATPEEIAPSAAARRRGDAPPTSRRRSSSCARFDPPGVACRDLREMPAAAARRAAAGARRDLAASSGHPASTGTPSCTGSSLPLAKALGVELSELQSGRRDHQERSSRKPGPQVSRATARIYVEPDVFVRKIGDEYVIQLNDDGLPRLRISRAYRQDAAADARRGPPVRGATVHQGQDALGDLADQEPRPAPAHDLQGRRLDRPPAARVPRPRHRAPAAAGAARRRRRHRHARVDGLAAWSRTSTCTRRAASSR